VYRKGLRLRGADVSRMGVGGIANLQVNKSLYRNKGPKISSDLFEGRSFVYVYNISGL